VIDLSEHLKTVRDCIAFAQLNTPEQDEILVDAIKAIQELQQYMTEVKSILSIHKSELPLPKE
jgi:hypothetical protein